MNFRGKLAVITGGGRGMGKAIALSLAKEGASVAILDINQENALTTAEQIERSGNKAIGIKMDVSNLKDVISSFEIIDRDVGDVDILINTAGIQRVASILDEEEDAWDRVMAVNIKGTFLCCKEACKRMIPKSYGKIINFGSAAGLQGVGYMLSYSTSKFGVIGFSQALAQEVGKYNINVNVLCPGCVDTDMWRDTRNDFAKYIGVSEKDQFKQTASQVPLGRVANVNDIVKVVTFLASENSQYISAQSISVCGGLRPH
jgi:meso-butanediol dehydrogenase/(S,S)-butanediol dehydrogenase/diacetyl reductase